MPIRSILGSLTLAMLMGLGGCATSPPASFYTLMPIAAADARHGPLEASGPAIGLGPVTFPRFLDRPQIVTRDGVALRFDEFHRWAGSLDDDFLRVWGENLAHLLGTSRIVTFPSEAKTLVDYRVLAEVLSFAASAEGMVDLKVRWAVLDPYLERTLVVRENLYRRPLPAAADEATLVACLSEVLGDFSRDVADAIRRLARPVPHDIALKP